MATGRLMNRPPPHLQGTLVFHSTGKLGIPRSKRGFFVLLETVIHRYDSERNYYKGQKSTKEFEIRLDEVCEITDVLFPSKQYKNCSFRVALSDSDTEYTFSAESREEMEQWVNGLRRAKEFWAQHYRWEEVKQNFRQDLTHLNQSFLVQNEGPKLEYSLSGTSYREDKSIAQILVTTWDGIMHKLLLPIVFDAEELLSSLSGKVHVRRTGFATCPTCKLQQSSMEIWTVTESGIGKKLDRKLDALDVSKHGQHFYLLVHNYKLLIVHFEDHTFLVLPCLISLKAKEVPFLPVVADKLSSLGLSNFGLFLVNDAGTSMPFAPEDQPLKHSFQGRLLLKDRVLTVSSPVSPSRLEIQIQQRIKAQQKVKNMKALQKLEQQKCKQNSAFPSKNTNNTALTSPRELVFHFDHYDVTDDQNKPHVNCASHAHTKHTTQNGDSYMSNSIGYLSVKHEQRSSQGRSIFQEKENNFSNRDECFVRDGETNSGLQLKDEFIDCSHLVSTERCEGNIVQENKESIDNGNSCAVSQNVRASCLPPISSDRALTQSLEPPESPPESGSQYGNVKESMKKESSYPSVCESLYKNNGTLSTRIGGELSLTNGGCEEPNFTLEGLTIEGKETDVELNDVANSEFVNQQNCEPTNKDGSFSVKKEDISALKNNTSGGELIKSQCVERNDETTASQNTTEAETPIECHLSDDKTAAPNTTSDDDTSIESYFSAEKDDVPSQISGDNNLKRSLTRTACNGSNTLAHKEAPSQKAIIADPRRPIGNFEIQKVCKERPHLEIHQCDYTIVGSPCVLELVLKVCSGRKVNEEEVGEANTFTRICLSGWHLQCENGTWSLVERGRVPTIISESVSSTVKVRLTKNLEALFHKEEKLWTVRENEHVVGETLSSADPMEKQTLNGALEIPKEASKNLRAGSNSDLNVLLLQNELQGDATFHSKSENVIQDQSMPVTLNVPDKSSRQRKVGSTTNYDVKHVTETREEEKKLEMHPRSALPKSSSNHSPERALHAAIKGVFDHMSKCSGTPEEALDDSKHEGFVQDTCEPLCRALWNILSIGLRKKNFLCKYKVWNVVENFKDVSSHVSETVTWVNKRYPFLEEPQKFQAFVCECLNIGHGTLHRWLESCLRQKERLAKCYGEAALMFQLPRAKLEELVFDLSRVSSLPFQLHSESWIKKHHYHQDSPAFAFE